MDIGCCVAGMEGSSINSCAIKHVSWEDKVDVVVQTVEPIENGIQVEDKRKRNG